MGVPGDPQGARPRVGLRLARLERAPAGAAASRAGVSTRRRRAAGLSLAELYVQGREHEDLYRIAEALLELDEQAQLWRLRHYQVVARVIGDKVVGTQGTPVELLGRLVTKTSFPELWEVRNELTALSKSGAG